MTSDAAAIPAAVERSAVIDLLQSVSAEIVLDRLVDVIVAGAVRHVGAACALLALPHDATWTTAAIATVGADRTDVSIRRTVVTEAPMDALVDQVFQTRQTASTDVDPLPRRLGQGDDSPETRSHVAVPLLNGERLLGVLCLEFAKPSSSRSHEQTALTSLLASQAAISLQHARRYERAGEENRERRQAAAESERVLAALQESEARFRSMADTTPDIIWITQLNPERVVYASPSFERIFGKKVADLYANPHLWIEGIHPEDRERVGATFAAWIESGSTRPWEVEFRVVHPSGSIRWIHDRGVFMSEAGGPQRVSGIATDITERRRAEAALRESEQRYALAMEAARDGHWDWIAETDDFYASPRMLEIYGFPPETRFAGRQDFLNRFPFHPEDEPRWRLAASEHFAGKTPRFDIEIRMLRAGEVRWIHTNGLVTRDPDGRPLRYTGSVSDITERKAAENALRASEQRFALVVAGSTDGIWDWDLAADKMFLSEQAKRLYGVNPEPVVRSPAEWFAMATLHPDDVQLRQDLFTGYLTGRVPSFDGEWRVLHPDGSYRWVRARGTGVRDTAGRITRMAGSVNDVDFRRRAEAALHQAQRLEALGTLAGGIAHDFNNILGAILGFGEMALRDSRSGSRVRRDIESMLTAGERGRSLVERILAFSRTGVGERVPVHLEAIVREAIDMISAGLPDNVEVCLALNGGRAAVLGDATQLHQVLMNLATNAIQAITDGGVLHVALDPVRLDEPRLVTTGEVAIGDYLLLSVQDSGCGMTPQVLSRVFDPFFTTKDVGTGTGLGLSLVHGTVSELGGAIDVVTSVDGGSAFAVYLPCCGDAADMPAQEVTPLERGRLEQVLLVDDEHALLRLMTGTLLKLGYVPVGFSSGPEALAAFKAHPDRFDAVVTDERMPGLSGVELIRAIRKIRPTIPVVMVSGYLGAGIDRRARDAGADAVLRKPLVTAELASALARSLRDRSVGTASAS